MRIHYNFITEVTLPNDKRCSIYNLLLRVLKIIKVSEKL